MTKSEAIKGVVVRPTDIEPYDPVVEQGRKTALEELTEGILVLAMVLAVGIFLQHIGYKPKEPKWKFWRFLKGK